MLQFVLVLVIVIVLVIAIEKIEYEHDYEHEHERTLNPPTRPLSAYNTPFITGEYTMSGRLRILVMLFLVLAGVLAGTRAAAYYNSPYKRFSPLVDIHHAITQHYVEKPDDEALFQGAIHGMIAQLNDPYSFYMPPRDFEEFSEFSNAEYSGIGAQVIERDGWLVIASPMEDSPAWNAGVRAGDVILEINGETAEGVSIQSAINKIKGKPGTTVQLKLRHEDGTEQSYEIIRGSINVQTIKGFRRSPDQHWDYMLDPDAGIAYARVISFSEPTSAALKEAIQSALASGMKGLILDLRFNPGGLLEQAVEMSDFFLSDGVIVSQKGRNRSLQEWKAKPENDLGDFPIVVLVNEDSASASEIVAGALKDNHRAIILGTRSFGKGSVQDVYELQDDAGAFKITSAWYYLPSGRNIHRTPDSTEWGVDPNDGYNVPMTRDQILAMFNQRQQSDILRTDNTQPPPKITHDYLAQTLADPQLAAAYTALLGKLQTGEFTPVSTQDATQAQQQLRRYALQERRDFIQTQLDALDAQIKKLDEPAPAESPTPEPVHAQP